MVVLALAIGAGLLQPAAPAAPVEAAFARYWDAKHPGDRQGLALIGMVFFAVGREGLESLFFLLAIIQQSEGSAVPTGAARRQKGSPTTT